FRPRRGCQSALTKIHHTWNGTKWFIEGDIKGCFDNIDAHILMDILQENIYDNRFLRLIEGALKAGYCEDWNFHPSLSGTPQGGIVSPVLSNIYGRLFGRKGTVSLMTPCVDGNVRPHSGVSSGQARCWWSASRGQRDLCVGRRPTRSRRVGQDQKGKPVSGEDET